MGQKVNPNGLRLGITRTWTSKWYAERQDYKELLHEDIRIKRLIKEKLKNAGVSEIEMERFTQRLRITIHAARPGIIIGHKGKEVEVLKKKIEEVTGREVIISIKEVKIPELNSQLVAEAIAAQLVNRAPFRRAIKKALLASMDRGALGMKIMVAGRLGGAEMSRTETVKEGKIPLHSLRADIDYGLAEAFTTYGAIGVKVWIYKGDILDAQTEEGEE